MRYIMKIIAVALSVLAFAGVASAAMEDYCIVPPYVIQNVPPNVMLMVDNSGSMFNFAYTFIFDEFDETVPTQVGTATPDIYVADASTFPECGDIILWQPSGSGGWSGTLYPVSSVDTVNNIIRLRGYNVNYDTTYRVQCSLEFYYEYFDWISHAYYNTEKTFDPGKSYYGYFNSSYWYSYGSSKFTPTAKKSDRGKYPSEWDGSFLNWLSMRRIDVLRRVLTGGLSSAGNLMVQKADDTSRGVYKEVDNAENYIDSTYSGTRCFKVDVGSGSANFRVSSSALTGYCPSADSSFVNFSLNSIAVPSGTVIEGVLQEVAGDRARMGITHYNTPSDGDEGGNVVVSVGGQALSSTINDINNMQLSANTPLGEALWSVTGYYAQKDGFNGSIFDNTIRSTGPNYSNDYSITATDDPLNYGGSSYTSARYPKCARSFVLLITDGEPWHDGNLPAQIKSYGANSEFNCAANSCPGITNATGGNNYSFPASTIPYYSADETGLEDVALWIHTKDLRDAAMGTMDVADTQNLTTYVINAFGKGSTLLRYAAINGGFQDYNGSGTPDSQTEWDQDGDGQPDNFYEADDGQELYDAIKNALENILRRASSGTAASVLASGEGSGASLIQAVFYPRRRFGNKIITWSGALQNFWYFVDPFFLNNTVLEDTDHDSYLDLGQDLAVRLYFDDAMQSARADLFITNSVTGAPIGNAVSNVPLEEVNYLWEAGLKLWQRDITNSAEARSLYTPDIVNSATYTYNPDSGTSSGLVAFVNSSAATFVPYMGVANTAEAVNIINYTQGEDVNLDPDSDGVNEYRDRKVTIAGISNTPAIWKLGDILNSTPKIATWLPLNAYDTAYGDSTYTNYVASAGYAGRGAVFAGGNDGMLHAFKLGTIQLSWSGQLPYQKAHLAGSDLGKELWSFIPQHVLPYLKYIPAIDYCHLYTVDLSPYIFDASIGIDSSANLGNAECSAGYQNCVRTVNSWRTIIVGGMRYGGGCRQPGSGCTDCVDVPVSVSTASGTKYYGYSSYFALDITDSEHPVFMWEFSANDLGFSTTGPSVVRINGLNGLGNQDTTRNGKWFVVFGSGPTGPINKADHQFMGRSDQNLKFYALDLRTGAPTPLTTNIQKAFAGSMVNVTVDPDGDYQDDAVYVGYTKRTGTNPNYTWTAGGVGRIWTRENLDPSQWVFKEVIDNIGPVTASISSLKSNSDLWLYFGSGRYFFDLQNASDDFTNTRYLYGVSDPCYLPGSENFDSTCSTVLSQSDLGSADSAASVDPDGWYITMDPYAAGVFGAERVITDPLASSTGVVFFTSFRPYDQVCGLGGKSYIWAVDYATGWVPSVLRGSALIQVSTGSIERVDLGSVFTDKGGRRSASMEGVPPTAQGFSLFLTPPPVERMIHIKER